MNISKSFSMLFLALTVLLFCTACNDEDVLQAESAQMEAVLNGNTWTAEQGASAAFIQGLFNLSGKAADGSAITITITGFEEAEYQSYFNANNGNVLVYVSDDTGTTPAFASHGQGGSGTVIITDINFTDSLVSGTFEFTGVGGPSGTGAVEVTNGVFTDVPFITETVNIGDNTLEAKIDGADWEAQMVSGLIAQDKLNIIGTGPQAIQTIALYIPTNISVGSYELGSPFSSDYGAQFNQDSQTFLMAETGELKITQHDISNKIIEGTFSFEAKQFGATATASITEGSFYASY